MKNLIKYFKGSHKSKSQSKSKPAHVCPVNDESGCIVRELEEALQTHIEDKRRSEEEIVRQGKEIWTLNADNTELRNKVRCHKFSAKKNGDALRFQTQENEKLREMLSEQARENSKLQTEMTELRNELRHHKFIAKKNGDALHFQMQENERAKENSKPQTEEMDLQNEVRFQKSVVKKHEGTIYIQTDLIKALQAMCSWMGSEIKKLRKENSYLSRNLDIKESEEMNDSAAVPRYADQ